MVEAVSNLTDAIDLKFDGMKIEVNLLKCVMVREEDRAHLSKINVPDSKSFCGAHSAKDFENFLVMLRKF